MGKPWPKPATVDNNLETYSLVWLDTEVNRSRENVSAQDKLRILINHLKTFDDGKICEEYIRSLSETDRIVFIVSGGLGQEIVPKIHQLRQIFSIYIYCLNKKKYEVWAESYTKIQGVFVELDELIERIRFDQDRRKTNKVDEQLPISIFNRNAFENHWINESNDHFIYSQVLINCLLQISINPNEKKELMILCRTEYKNNKDELKTINEFDTQYSSNKAIWWYTRQSFLYEMLTKAFKIQNHELLFLFRYVIHDIQIELNENRCLTLKRVYRGQLIASEELKMLKRSLGQFLSINSFLTAIHDRRSARLFLLDSIISDGIERVLFEIDIDTNDLDDLKSFSNIRSKNYYNQEEILFSIGSVFRLRDIRLEEEGILIIHMSLCSNNHAELKPVFQHIEEQYGGRKTSLLSFGLDLQKMKKFEEAKKFYQWIKKILPQNQEYINQCDNQIKIIDNNQNLYNKNLEIIEGKMERSKNEDSSRAFSHTHMGAMYRDKRDYDGALKSYNEALRIWKGSYNDDHKEVGRCYFNIGLIHQETEEYEKALEYYEEALPILEKYLPRNHIDLRIIYSNIGDMHQYLNHYDEALPNYLESLEIAQQASNTDKSITVALLNKIALIYEKDNNFQQALFYYEQITPLLPSTHDDIKKNKEDIQRISDQLK